MLYMSSWFMTLTVDFDPFGDMFGGLFGGFFGGGGGRRGPRKGQDTIFQLP